MSGGLLLKEEHFRKGACIVAEGKGLADRFFIIRQGKVRISNKDAVVEGKRSAMLGPGDFFGVIAAMSSHSHIETAEARTDTVLIPVKKDEFAALIQQDTPMAMKILFHLSRKLHLLGEILTKLTLERIADTHPSHLFDVGDYYAHRSRYDLAYYAYSQYLAYCPEDRNAETAQKQMLKLEPYTTAGSNSSIDQDAIDQDTIDRDTMASSEEEFDDEVYIIRKGAVKIVKIVDNREIPLMILKEGNIFKEMALLESALRSADAVVYENNEVLTVNRSSFERMAETHPWIIARLTALFSERLWSIYKNTVDRKSTETPSGAEGAC
jgi:CRP-like cAMP-binding protein